MDYRGLAVDAWRITRRGRPLLWLGLVSAAQAVLYAAILSAVMVPLVALPQLMLAPDSVSATASAPGDAVRERLLLRFSEIVTAHGPALLAWMVGVLAVWIVLGVLDVASQAGLITQADAQDRGRPVSFRTGMRDGFRVWWRVVGLFAISALPALFTMIGMGLVMLFTITLPLLHGTAPDPRAALVGNAVLSPFSTACSLAAIPLGVIVQLALRNAVLADEGWRQSFWAGWKALRGNVIEVGLVYLLVLGVGVGVGVLGTIAVAVLGGAAAVAVVPVALAAGSGAAVVKLGTATGVVAVVALMLLVLVLVALTVLVYVWSSCVWTLYWTRSTPADELAVQ